MSKTYSQRIRLRLRDVSAAWCEPETAGKAMDIELAKAFQKTIDAHFANLPDVLERVDAVMEELVDIGSDVDARREMDSFTFQPIQQILAELRAWRDEK